HRNVEGPGQCRAREGSHARVLLCDILLALHTSPDLSHCTIASNGARGLLLGPDSCKSQRSLQGRVQGLGETEEEEAVKNALANKELSCDLLKGLVITPITTGLNFALLAPPGAGKTTICQGLLKEAVEAGLRCLYRIINTRVSLIKEQFRSMV